MNKVIEFDKQMHGELEKPSKQKKFDPAIVVALMVGKKTKAAIDEMKAEITKLLKGFGNTNPEENEFNAKQAAAVSNQTLTVESKDK